MKRLWWAWLLAFPSCWWGAGAKTAVDQQIEHRPDGTKIERFHGEASVDKNTEDLEALRITPPPPPGNGTPRIGGGVGLEGLSRKVTAGTLGLYLLGGLFLAGGIGLAFNPWFRLPVPGLAFAATGLLMLFLPTLLPVVGTLALVGGGVAILIGAVWAVVQILERRKMRLEDLDWTKDMQARYEKLWKEGMDGNAESRAAAIALLRAFRPEVDTAFATVSDVSRGVVTP
ncbi:MAG: hypothetical protein A3E78_09180 [Alphaproteobacteria bacterium RIFCSPHIGHO2_12_FULL_63_12]|nr:MAG: hypothetical protein A3E78_09180 [Alphaproteobacteria bacterium RIFCSPHIGHO2_12_FULL_63_12]